MVNARNPSRRNWLTDDSFIAHRMSLLISAAWRKRPQTVAKILERIEIEHLSHGGQENGNLVVTYNQFVRFGISRRSISRALQAASELGLIEVIQDSGWIGDVRAPNKYRITYLPAAGKRAPTDEWSKISEESASQIVSDFRRSISA